MKKTILVIALLLSSALFSKTQYIDIGPLEEQDNAQPICQWACTKNNLNWTGGWECQYSPELDQHRCYCECTNNTTKKKTANKRATQIQKPMIKKVRVR